ncbi:hypothetical protein H828_YJM1478D00213 [Saccharomyces cerevisiae YJM1478]|uniref:Uncharacterized protein YDL022C-A n=2 Tax=Saccharomyces cerevisiae TaxID=4932 RepID=YD022_YEAST|nr:uncharacterized protein YDL022C-A [Saccharomyces cerevisiae S288C]P0C5L6.1 RecName: Full=Uncharacterized protein YDL022C-A [Saccharomyces cerevisiae S288C]AHY74979.1 hypothetical protein H779_YJM993D00209 [Saccharomyces cerevisiae YJM993]AJP37717.1 hypothetical protein F842_YJM1078D00209 [Saccharomyces cerevisiae YJM1078]AJU57829.1 hypothetical protein H747_YJM189D00210 [Saccharomyces cerevisiae YJM189]AJU59933.1 hypothetical protein H750_YJM244D00210 [Saccharomyces cerevisiae YJM244]AJU60|eukprot:NP_001257670.1 hypothetical protein YDL022C-A [Saccharomyces cerevisiae S288C]
MYYLVPKTTYGNLQCSSLAMTFHERGESGDVLSCACRLYLYIMPLFFNTFLRQKYFQLCSNTPYRNNGEARYFCHLFRCSII